MRSTDKVQNLLFRFQLFFQYRDAPGQAFKTFQYGVGKVCMLQVDTDVRVLAAYHAPGVAYHCAVGRNILQHDAARADLYLIADSDGAQHLCAGAHGNTATQGGVALADIFTGTAQSDTLIKCYIVTDHGGLTDHGPAAVVNKQSLTDSGTGVDVNACSPSGAGIDQTRQQEMLFQVQSMGMTIAAQSTETGVTKHDFQSALYSRVSIHHGLYVFF